MRRLREGGRGWRGLEPSCDIFKTCNVVNKHANQRYFQEAEDLRWGSWCFEQIFEQGMFSSSDVVYDVSISWNYILLCPNDNFRLKKMRPKLKETTVNNFEQRLDRSIEEYTRENSESVKQYARIGLLLYLLLKLLGMTAYSTVFPWRLNLLW